VPAKIPPSMSIRDQQREDIHFRLLRLIELHPDYSQRDHAAALGVSTSKVHYIIRGLIDKGLVKIGHFQHGDHKLDKIAYLLTPAGIHNRVALTRAYIARKNQEYEDIQAELAGLEAELGPLGPLGPKAD
jgi:EPS-associated MarR family transcriptional regulator